MGPVKASQVGYFALWYIGPKQEVRRLDFMGLVPEAAVNEGVRLIFRAATAILLVAAQGGRACQLRA